MPKPTTPAQNAAASASTGKVSPVRGSAGTAAAAATAVAFALVSAVRAGVGVGMAIVVATPGAAQRFTKATPSALAVSPLRTAQISAASVPSFFDVTRTVTV